MIQGEIWRIGEHTRMEFVVEAYDMVSKQTLYIFTDPKGAHHVISQTDFHSDDLFTENLY